MQLRTPRNLLKLILPDKGTLDLKTCCPLPSVDRLVYFSSARSSLPSCLGSPRSSEMQPRPTAEGGLAAEGGTSWGYLPGWVHCGRWVWQCLLLWQTAWVLWEADTKIHRELLGKRSMGERCRESGKVHPLFSGFCFLICHGEHCLFWSIVKKTKSHV